MKNITLISHLHLIFMEKVYTLMYIKITPNLNKEYIFL